MPNDDAARRLGALVPKPVRVEPNGELFTLSPETQIVYEPGADWSQANAQGLARSLHALTDLNLSAVPIAADVPASIILGTAPAPGDNPEAYSLSIRRNRIELTAGAPPGFFYGAQTLLQLLPAQAGAELGAWSIAGAEIFDAPRYPWRGLMLDVARHFFAPVIVKRLLDKLALYKMNRLHLHLSDDQGWRIDIKSHPDLARIGGSTAVGGGAGGYYSQAEYAELVQYGSERHIVVVPEIDLPGHTNAALASVPALNCDGVARPLYTGIEVGFSTLCVDKDQTYTFVDDVVRELAELTPGPYLHLGGDETQATAPDDYARFMARAQEIVRRHGKQFVGWQEVGKAQLLPGALAQYWASNAEPREGAALAAAQGAQIIMSPASHTYLDMKCLDDFPLGLQWAGFVTLENAYRWEPEAVDPDIPPRAITGVEAALWSETLQTLDDIEYMLFPRLLATAEIGWSPANRREWDDFRRRLAAHGRRFDAMGINYYPSPEIDWDG